MIPFRILIFPSYGLVKNPDGPFLFCGAIGDARNPLFGD